MGQRPRERPEHLAAKLLAIRQHLGLSQSQTAKRIGLSVHYARISEYEHGIKEPNLLVLLRYSEIAGVHMETLVNDLVDIAQFNVALKRAISKQSQPQN